MGPGRSAVARRALVATVAVVVPALGTRTHLRNRDWRDNTTLFLADLATNTGSFKLQMMAADRMLPLGRTTEALALLERVRERVGHVTPEAGPLLGKLYEEQGRYAEAQRALEEAVTHERGAIAAWRQLVAAAGDFYNDDLMMGVRGASLCGHWKDELAALENGLADLERRRRDLPAGRETAKSSNRSSAHQCL